MADFNEKKVNKISEAIVKLNTNLIKTGEIYTEIFSDIKKFNNELKESKDIVNSLKKSQKGLNESTNKLTEAEKKSKKAADQLEKQRQKGLVAMKKWETKERALITAATKEIKSIDDLKGRIKALTTIRDRLDRSTDKGARKFKLLTNEIRKNRQELKKTRTTQSGLIGVFKRQIGAIATMAAGYLGLQAVIRGITGSISIFAKFDRQISKVGAVSGATTNELRELRNLAQTLGESTEKTAVEVAGLEVNLSKLGFTSKQILAATGAILDLSTAADADLGQAATVVAATIKGFGLAAADATRVTDVMALSFSSSALDLGKFENAMSKVAPVAKNANVSLERSTAFLSLLTDRGLEASIAGTSLRNIFLELSNKGLTWNEAMAKINLSTDKNKIAMELFGKRGATAAIILAENAEQGDILTEKYERAAGAAKRMADIMRDNLVGDADKAKSALEGLAINLVTKLNPFLRSSTQGFTNFIGKINELVKTNPSDEIQKEQVALNILVGRITSANIEQEQRNELIEELQIKYPDFLKNLDSESATNKELADNLKLANEEFIKKFIIQSQQERLQKEGRKVADARNKASAIEMDLLERITEAAIKNGIENQLLGKTIEEQVDLVRELGGATIIYDGRLRLLTAANEDAAEAFEKFNEISEDANKIMSANGRDLKILNDEMAEFQRLADSIDADILGDEGTDPEITKLRIENILKEAEATGKLAEARLRSTEAFIKERDEIAEEADEEDDIFAEIETENEEKLRLTQEFLDKKAEMQEAGFLLFKEIAEKEAKLEDLKSNALMRGLGVLGSIFSRKSILGKAAFAIQKALAISEIFTNLNAEIASYWKTYAFIPFSGPIIAAGLSATAKARATISIVSIAAQAVSSFKEGTKGKYDTPSEFVTSEHGAGTEAVIKKTGDFMITTKPTYFSDAEGSRVVSNPELRQMMNDSGKSSYGSLDLGDLRNDINRGNKEIVKSIDNIPQPIFDKDGNNRGFKEGTYEERVL